MWERLNKLIKPNGAIVLFGSEPFSSALRMSNIKNYKYDWIWKKSVATGFLSANKRPLKDFENILVFYENQPLYNPQKTYNENNRVRYIKEGSTNSSVHNDSIYGNGKRLTKQYDKSRFPKTVLEFKSPPRNNQFKKDKSYHPTQKPIPLMEYLIKTYTNENELVLDFTMGSGTTMVACVNTNRKGIGIELDRKYFDIAKKRVNDAIKEKKQNLFEVKA